MTTERAVDIALAGLVLLLPLSAVIGRRMPIGRTFRMAAIWLAIFAAGYVIVRQLARFGDVAMSSDDRHLDETAMVNGMTRMLTKDRAANWSDVSANERRFPRRST